MAGNNPYINNVAVHQFYEKYTKTYVNIYTDPKEGYIAFDSKNCKVLSKNMNMQRCSKLARIALTDHLTSSVKQYIGKTVIFRERYKSEWKIGIISQIILDISKKKESYYDSRNNVKLEIKSNGNIFKEIDRDNCCLIARKDFAKFKKLLKEKIRIEKLDDKLEKKIDKFTDETVHDVINSTLNKKEE